MVKRTSGRRASAKVKDEMEIRYDQASDLRTTPCLAWIVDLITFDGRIGGQMVFISDLDVTVEGVIDMLGRQEGMDADQKFVVRNVTVGAWWLGEQAGDAYFNDARGVDREGMVRL